MNRGVQSGLTLPAPPGILGVFSDVPTWRSQYKQNNSTATLVAGSLYLTPVYFPRRLSIDGIGGRVSAGAASSTVTCALYSDTGTFFPGALLLNGTATTSTSAVTPSDLFPPVIVTPGWYWQGMMALGGNPSVQMSDGRAAWTGMPHGTAAALTVNNGNDGSVAVQSGLSALPQQFAGSLQTDSNAPAVPLFVAFRMANV